MIQGLDARINGESVRVRDIKLSIKAEAGTRVEFDLIGNYVRVLPAKFEVYRGGTRIFLGVVTDLSLNLKYETSGSADSAAWFLRAKLAQGPFEGTASEVIPEIAEACGWPFDVNLHASLADIELKFDGREPRHFEDFLPDLETLLLARYWIEASDGSLNFTPVSLMTEAQEGIDVDNLYCRPITSLESRNVGVGVVKVYGVDSKRTLQGARTGVEAFDYDVAEFSPVRLYPLLDGAREVQRVDAIQAAPDFEMFLLPLFGRRVEFENIGMTDEVVERADGSPATEGPAVWEFSMNTDNDPPVDWQIFFLTSPQDGDPYDPSVFDYQWYQTYSGGGAFINGPRIYGTLPAGPLFTGHSASMARLEVSPIGGVWAAPGFKAMIALVSGITVAYVPVELRIT